MAVYKLLISILFSISIIGIAEAQIPNVILDSTQDFAKEIPSVILGYSGLYCDLDGCTMRGNIDMDNYSIINANWVNATYTNVSINYTQLSDEHWVNESGDVMTGNLNMSNNDITDVGNITLGEKITFALGEIIDNIADGWITITGGLNVTGNVTIGGDFNIINDSGESMFSVNSSSGNVNVTGNTTSKIYKVGNNSIGGICSNGTNIVLAWNISRAEEDGYC